MSLELTRRSFLKYTALTAVAVAGSSLLTGCKDNPYQPVGKPGDTLELMGKHCLKNPVVYGQHALECELSIQCTSNRNLSVDVNCFQIEVTDQSGNTTIYSAGRYDEVRLSNVDASLEKKETLETRLTVGNIDLHDKDTIAVKYWPRKNASLGLYGYTDAYCTWRWTYEES